MNKDQVNYNNYFDRIRISDGVEKCREVFSAACEKSVQKTVNLLNDQLITFPCLFVLLPQIKALRLHSHLNSRNRAAAGITDQILNMKDASAGSGDYLSANNESTHSALKWMLQTGCNEYDLDDSYKKVLDAVVSILINSYEDKSVLPVVCDMIFKRSGKEHNIHNLVWAFFRSGDPSALRLTAEHLQSDDQKEAELAGKLLGIDEENEGNEPGGKRKYQDYLSWLEENDPFLYFTGESLQYAGKPKICEVDLKRKYLHKANPSHTNEQITHANSNEEKCLQAFEGLNNEDKAALASYSSAMHTRNSSEWEKWITSSFDEQVRSAKTAAGGKL
ncbi:MAG: hypothetical protein LBL09_01950 [Oscillospiraceae bacterium]|nr:hypothetical protein [Oscillospiraceae bacterium]